MNENNAFEAPKKKRGRPARPRTEEELNRPKRKPGRPKKVVLDETNSEEVLTPIQDDKDPLPFADEEQLNEQKDEDFSDGSENND